MPTDGPVVRLRAPRRSDRGVYRALDGEQRATPWRAGDPDDPWAGIDLEVDERLDEGPGERLFTIEDRDAVAIGRARIHSVVAVHRRARVDVEVLPEVRGVQVLAGALSQLAELAFRRLDLHKVWREVRGDDEVGLEAARLAGLRADSRRLNERFDDGIRHDVIVLSRLVTDPVVGADEGDGA